MVIIAQEVLTNTISCDNICTMTELEQTPKQEILDLSTEEMTQRFAEAPIYAKSGVVEARIAEAEEEVTTVLEDGTVETVNTAQAGD
jgi:hypothetical protein